MKAIFAGVSSAAMTSHHSFDGLTAKGCGAVQAAHLWSGKNKRTRSRFSKVHVFNSGTGGARHWALCNISADRLRLSRHIYDLETGQYFFLWLHVTIAYYPHP